MAKIQINSKIVKQCREQMYMSIEAVRRKVKSIEKIEAGEKDPTFKQLDDLADLYAVPRWVFIAEALPEDYQYDAKPIFRRMREATEASDGKILRLVAQIEQYRKLFLELRDDIEIPITDFNPPRVYESPPIYESPEETAHEVRSWLGLTTHFDFATLREKLEQKDIFIFVTSKYKGWSYAGDTSGFRGLSIYYPRLPIVIINDSDSMKAQSFTLLHALGQILLKRTQIILNLEQKTQEEKWCDIISGNILMPIQNFNEINNDLSLPNVDELAKKFKVSSYACLVRLHQLELIGTQKYENLRQQLRKQHRLELIGPKKYEVPRQPLREKNAIQKKTLEKLPRGRAQKRPREVEKQFGKPFIRAVLDNYSSNDLTLLKSAKILDMKSTSHFLELAKEI